MKKMDFEMLIRIILTLQEENNILREEIERLLRQVQILEKNEISLVQMKITLQKTNNGLEEA
jgi:cell division septum initiation protein DivIVA